MTSPSSLTQKYFRAWNSRDGSRAVVVACTLLFAGTGLAANEAPTGFDGQSNGFLSQSDFDRVRAVFEHTTTLEEGLGPLFTGESCLTCHGFPVTGGNSHVFTTFVGRADAEPADSRWSVEHVDRGDSATRRGGVRSDQELQQAQRNTEETADLLSEVTLETGAFAYSPFGGS